MHRMEKSHVINTFTETWKQVGDHFSALTTGFEAPLRTHDPATSTLALSTESWNVNGLAIEAVQLGFVVKRVDLAGTAVHEEENDAPSLGCMGEEWALQIGREIWGKTMGRLGLARDPRVPEEVGQSDAGESTAGLPQELPTSAATEM